MSHQDSKLPLGKPDNEALLHSMWIVGLPTFVNFLKAAIDLNLFDIIAKSNKHMSAHEIASHLPKHNHEETPNILDRMLSLFTTFSLLECTTETIKGSTGSGVKVQRRYAISQAGLYFAYNEDGGSLAPWVSQQLDPLIRNIRLNDAILEGGTPFDKTHGSKAYEIIPQHPSSFKLFNKAMSAWNVIEMKRMLEIYEGFKEIKLLVDVGGGNGTCLKSIIFAHSHITGINFDQPHVVKDASPTPGITHVGGNFFTDIIPKGDSVLLMNVLHNWGDEDCIKLLKNCYQAIPENGKVIVIDPIIPTVPAAESLHKTACLMDCVMFNIQGARERYIEDFVELGEAAGFSEVKLVCFVAPHGIMEFHK